MKRLFSLLLLLAPLTAFAWGCLELPSKVQRDKCWEKLQAEAQKPTPPEQKAIEEKNAIEAQARLEANRQELRQAMQARAVRDQLEQERLAREYAYLRQPLMLSPQPPYRYAAPRSVFFYGPPLVYRPTAPYSHHAPARLANVGGRF